MRISDWSSDVCSSDLRRARIGETRVEPAGAIAAADLTIGEDVRRQLVRKRRIVGEIVGVDAVVDDPRWPAGGQAGPQIVKPRGDAPPVAGIAQFAAQVEAVGDVTPERALGRSEKRRVGKGCVTTCRSR